jgi:N-methylhydantoinase A
MAEALLAIDIGGTFTDIVVYEAGGKVGSAKVSSTATGELDERLAAGISDLLISLNLSAGAVRQVVHGSTVATNAVLQQTGARTALLTTGGFRDVLELRRIRYPERYNPFWKKPPPLVPRRLRMEISERIGADGEVVAPLDLAEVRSVITGLVEDGVESIAVCLLNAYRNAVHEDAIRVLIDAEFPSLSATYSCQLAPVAGEYERTSTTVCDAYVKPIVVAHQERLQNQLSGLGIEAPLLVMQSSGSLCSARRASDRPVFALESGPAAGVMAAAGLCRLLGLESAIAFDMGGTTAKACMIEDFEPFRAVEYEIGATASVGSRLLKGAGYLLRVRSIDVAEVGAGGGSIVNVDLAGGLQVGPESAGANPGPVCYGHGSERPTVTDANVLLGYLSPDALLGGDLRLDTERARAIWRKQVANQIGLSTEKSALGAHRIANANMERAVRLVSTERGFDPRTATLIAFGGSGPVHAANLAAGIGIRRIIVPPGPGVFSAVGLLTVSVGQEFVRELHAELDVANANVIADRFTKMEADCEQELRPDARTGEAARFGRFLDLRYAGQHRELTISFPHRHLNAIAFSQAAKVFRRQFHQTFGYVASDPIVIENVRVVASMPGGGPPVEAVLAALGSKPIAPGRPADRPAFFADSAAALQTPVIRRTDLDERPRPGPMIIEEYDSTIVVPPSFAGSRDVFGNVVIEREGAA